RGDESAAVVKREDVTAEWIERVNRFLKEHGLLSDEPPPSGSEDGPQFSHAWVVGGRKTTTGSAVLVSDPQTLVGNPSMFYEFHLRGKTFNVRGIGVAGSPVILIGFSERVAWGMTALGADQADLFRLKTDPDHPDQYFFDGQWRSMEVVEETISIKGRPPQKFKVRWTHFGPVITDYVFARAGDGEFAVKRVPVCVSDRETVQAAIAMMRARDAFEFGRALAGWQFPSANVVFGDRKGHIGYWVLGALPVRSRHAPRGGRFPHDGTASRFDWQGFLPHELKPHVINPKRGYLYSANHRPVGSFYKAYIGHSTGSMGHTLRSFRLEECLSVEERFAPEDVLAVHYSSVNPARRELVRLGLFLRDHQNAPLSDDARKALEYLQPWLAAGARSELSVRGAELAQEINTMFRAVNTKLAFDYGGGETGLTLFLKSIQRRLATPATARFEPREVEYVDRVLARAWRSAEKKYGPDPDAWPSRARKAQTQRKLGYYVSLDGFPSLDSSQDVPMPPLECLDGGTIRSQAAQAYSRAFAHRGKQRKA
ncbi:MAG TPA: penicillin acylase family protein, partial [Planctomycetaceae bacterium]|nr:penicillin acylase family protein [Planctomycetaceae bacterium]